MKCNNYGGRFIFPSFLFILFIRILASLNEIQSVTFSNYIAKFITANDESIAAEEVSDDNDSDKLRIFIGILTVPWKFERRDLLRRVYALQHSVVTNAKFDVKFVFCNVSDPDQAFLVSLEILTHNDIIILNCTENMDNGKTFVYFSALRHLLLSKSAGKNSPPYDYVMKADDDTYLRIGNLANSLTRLPRNDLYYGCIVPCSVRNPFRGFMSGMGYLVSWDIVEWLESYLKTVTPDRLIGPEDRRFENILTAGKRAKNRFTEKPGMYDYPEPPSACTHALWPGTVAVHLLKTTEKWIRTLQYFNVTLDLNPAT